MTGGMTNATETLNKLMNAAKAIKMAATPADTFEFGGQVLVADVALVAGVELSVAKEVLLAAHQAATVTLRRADLVEAMDWQAVVASEIRGPARSTFHLLSVK